MTGRWTLRRLDGAPADFLARPLPEPAGREVWWYEPPAPVLVLGSTQRDAVVDRSAARRAGTDVVRRRSGGGAVLVAPGDAVWVDIVLPREDPWWVDDVSRSSDRLGEVWAEVVRRTAPGRTSVHHGTLVRGPWSDLVCFPGLGPGEVRLDDRKVVGISQRRTRAGARFQCLLVRRWDPVGILALLDLDDAARQQALVDLAGAVGGVDVAPEAAVSRFLDALGEAEPG